MIPVLINEVGNWLDRFSETLNRWEDILNDIQNSYVLGDHESISSLCVQGNEIHHEIQRCKEQRQRLLDNASALGYASRSIRELSIQLDTQWPAIWTHRMGNLEMQLDRVQQLSISMWVTAFQSKSFVTEMLQILATGNSESATYSPGESHSLEGGYLVNEAA